MTLVGGGRVWLSIAIVALSTTAALAQPTGAPTGVTTLPTTLAAVGVASANPGATTANVARPARPAPVAAPPLRTARPPLRPVARPPAHPATTAARPPTSPAGAPLSASANTSSRPARPPEAAPDSSLRQRAAGGPTLGDTALGPDTPELRGLLAAERELFPPAAPALGQTWPSELAYPASLWSSTPRIHTSGLPANPSAEELMAIGASPRTLPEPARDWVAKAVLPDFPVHWDPQVVKYIEFFRDDPRGRSTIVFWFRRYGRYRNMVRRVLRAKGIPEDLAWLGMVESGYDSTIFSPVGAAGMWQFMPETGRVYGLNQDRWADQRMNPRRATEAAADYLSDLQRRFGSWDLAMAAYNMGYGGLLSVVKRYNVNDFWTLSKQEGALPWETTLYVPKIVAAAVVAKNLSLFGFHELGEEPALEGEEVSVPPQTALVGAAQALRINARDLEVLNPELRTGKTPPNGDYLLRVPPGRGAELNASLSRQPLTPLPTYTVRAGDSLDMIATRTGVAVAKIVETNRLSRNEPLKAGTLLLMPLGTQVIDVVPQDKVSVVAPNEIFNYPTRTRLFHRVVVGDSLRDLAAQYMVSLGELAKWNSLDVQARLQDGMYLQVFAPHELDLQRVTALREEQVRVVAAGTDEFFQLGETKNRSRIVTVARAGDTLSTVAKRFDVPIASAERINRRSRTDALIPGTSVVLYVDKPSPLSRVTPATLRTGPQVAPQPATPDLEPLPEFFTADRKPAFP
jgi:membrane-bound lytic murein transglycosylase D